MLRRINNLLKNQNIIFRLISSYLILNIFLSFIYGLNYDLSFSQNTSFLLIILLLFINFSIITILSHFLKNKKIDYYMSIILLFICSILWVQYEKSILFILTIFGCFYLLYKYKLNKLNVERVFNKYDKKFLIVLIIFIITTITCTMTTNILRYKIFGSPNFDLGIFSHNFYYMKKLGLPLSTCERDTLISHFMIHISPIFYLILPFYYLFSSPITLQVISVIIIFSAIIPIYLITKNHNLSNYVVFAICLLYTIYTPAITSTFFDFHENLFLIPLLFWLFYFYEKNHRLLFYITMMLVLFVKEDAAVYIIIFGTYMLFDNHKKLSIKTIIIAGLYLVLAIYLLKTYGDGIMSDRYSNLIYEDSGIIGIIKTVLLNPGYLLKQLTSSEGVEKLTYLIQMFLPLGFIPLHIKKWKNYILLLPMLLTTMTTYPYSFDITFHYSCGIIAFLFYLFILNLEQFKNKNYLFMCFVGSFLLFSSTIIPNYTFVMNNWNLNKEDYKNIDRLLSSIPKDASVSASAFFAPHLTNRDILYEVYYHENKLDIDYVVLDIKSEDITYYNFYINKGYIKQASYKDSIVILKKK